NTTVSHIRINDRKVIEEGLKVVEEEVNTSSDGKIVRAFLSTKLPLLDDEGKVYALCGISTDITERKKAEEIIRNMAFYDTLTGLPNRRMLDDRLSVLMANGKRSGKYGALMFLDMDHFKELNDTWGHKAGDALLIAAAERMLSCVRESDTVARLGGDEFIVAMGELDADEDVSKELALKLARKILESVNRPYAICIDEGSMETIEYRCSVSIGVTLFGKEDHESEKVLQRADHAMYEAKEEGRNGVVFRT
ncbi:sensor domain-containing diguanylate cyclase, partial [Sulfuricurvum sp.]